MSVTTLSIAPPNPTIAVGTVEAFSLIGTFSNGVTTATYRSRRIGERQITAMR
jgi:hypothetical protein